jgi:hypothetical protein
MDLANIADMTSSNALAGFAAELKTPVPDGVALPPRYHRATLLDAG